MKELIVKNHNNKLQCNYFSLIAPAPPNKIPESELPLLFLIKDTDGKVPDFKAERLTFTRFYTNNIPEMFSLLANETNPELLRNALLKQYNATINTEFAFYIFKRIA